MQVDFTVDIEPAKLIGSQQELAVLREAQRQRPGSPLLRERLATALLVGDRFDEAIALLGDIAAPNAREGMILVQAHLARETAKDDRQAATLVDRLLPTLTKDSDRAQYLADQAKAYSRLGRAEIARATLERALLLDPGNKDACKRLAAIDLGCGRYDDLAATLDGLAAKGTLHARLQAARALAHAGAGRIGESRAAAGFDDLHYAGIIDAPAGFADLATFNAALADELLGHPELRYDRYGTASQQTWRIDAPLLGRAPMVRLLLENVARAIEAHVARIAAHDHPWAKAMPPRGLLHSWCVITEGSGFETWHVHQFGWLSGVYYVQVPAAIEQGEREAGCIAFGLPEELAGEEASARFGTRIVRPREGLLMLFPSHCYHRTFPHRAAERRICFAFDVWPAA